MTTFRIPALLLAVTLVLVACGGQATSGSPQVTSTTESPTVGGGPTDETATTSSADPNRTMAPEIDLVLGEGGRFVLSDEQKPVYMVFWAEW